MSDQKLKRQDKQQDKQQDKPKNIRILHGDSIALGSESKKKSEHEIRNTGGKSSK